MQHASTANLWMRCGAVWILAAVAVPAAALELPAPPVPASVDATGLPVPSGDDYRVQALFAYQQQFADAWGGVDREIPLAAKADFYEWSLWRYHIAPYHCLTTSTLLPDQPGVPPTWKAGRDESTWTGALLAALSYKYAVTRDQRTLAGIGELLEGLHFAMQVTGQRGHLARSVAIDGLPLREDMEPYDAPDGQRYWYMTGPAKGTYNQVACGYATMMLLAYPDLPPATQQLARQDIASLALHVIDHDFRLTDRHGESTPYGDLAPEVAGVGIPFNGQVAYLIVALGKTFADATPEERARIEAAFHRLRHKHHVYYEHPLKGLVQPQRVGASPFLKGMNDRNHVTNAAFVGLLLDVATSRGSGQSLDENFVYRLGQTMHYSMSAMDGHHHALCSFMYAALLQDQAIFAAMVERKPNTVRGRSERNLVDGVEQLRRFPLNRFLYEGVEGRADEPVWIDQFRPDGYHWKNDAERTYTVTGPMTNRLDAAIDFLYAYWLMRYFGLDRHPLVVAQHADVLVPAVSQAALSKQGTTR